MKRIEQLSIVLVLILLLIQGSVSLAQKDINYWGPDTTSPAPRIFENYGDILDYNFKHVDDFLTTNILADRNSNITRRGSFDGHKLDEVATMDDFYLIYAEMVDAQVPYPDEITSIFDIYQDAEAHYEATGEVIIGVCDYDYDEIKQAAKDNGDAYWDGHQVKFKVGTDPSDLIEQKNTFVIRPLLSEITTDGPVTFKFSREHIFTNLDDHIDHIAVDFGDGNGFVNLLMGESYTAYYTEDGEHEITMLVNYLSSGYKQAKSIFVTKVPVTILEVDCGDEIPVLDGIQYVELPQAQFDINAPAIIDNPTNESGLVTGRAGIWYGCGDPCVLDKPFIIVSGYGPNIGKKNIWSHEPKKNLYSHYNGILGQDASHSFLAGQPNGTNLLYKLRNEGFDIVILEFFNGVDYPQNHAEAVIQLIELVNQEKDYNGSMHENIVMGQSMGGISSRLALARWEKQRMSANSNPFEHHECRTWINWEGEMQGATIPIGIQLYAKYLVSTLPQYVATALLQSAMGTAAIAAGAVTQYLLDLNLFYQALDNPAAKSMLTYHFDMNDQGFDPTLYKHPLYLALYAELDQLGYPQYLRRVAVADGSSTVERPKGLNRDANGDALQTCLMDLFGFIPKTTMKFRIRINTGELLQQKTVFRGWVTFNGLPLPTAVTNVQKIYTKAEYDAPGSYERFYKSYVLPLAKYTIAPCKSKNYRAPFVPTTSVFDVQDDYSLDFGYNCYQNLLFKESGQLDVNMASGFPHNNPTEAYPYEKTPFDACFANSKNTFHNQNPGLDIADFILSEVAPAISFIQNEDNSGLSQPYYRKIESPESIEIGKEVTEKIRYGSVSFGSSSVSELASPTIRIASGVNFKEGSMVLIASKSPENRNCTSLEHWMKGSSQPYESLSQKNDLIDHSIKVSVFPNPTDDFIQIKLPNDPDNYRVELRDLTGRILERRTTQKSIQMQLDFSSGIFFVKVFHEESNDELYSTKIIKL